MNLLQLFNDALVHTQALMTTVATNNDDMDSFFTTVDGLRVWVHFLVGGSPYKSLVTSLLTMHLLRHNMGFLELLPKIVLVRL